jgi:uncharacterized protein YjbJ (UPF0337 family)
LKKWFSRTEKARVFPHRIVGAALALTPLITVARMALDDLEKETKMAGTLDKAKGRIKEAAGALTDDPALKREGKIDQAAGDVKDGIEKAIDTVKETVTGKKRIR